MKTVSPKVEWSKSVTAIVAELMAQGMSYDAALSKALDHLSTRPKRDIEAEKEVSHGTSH